MPVYTASRRTPFTFLHSKARGGLQLNKLRPSNGLMTSWPEELVVEAVPDSSKLMILQPVGLLRFRPTHLWQLTLTSDGASSWPHWAVRSAMIIRPDSLHPRSGDIHTDCHRHQTLGEGPLRVRWTDE